MDKGTRLGDWELVNQVRCYNETVLIAIATGACLRRNLIQVRDVEMSLADRDRLYAEAAQPGASEETAARAFAAAWLYGDTLPPGDQFDYGQSYEKPDLKHPIENIEALAKEVFREHATVPDFSGLCAFAEPQPVLVPDVPDDEDLRNDPKRRDLVPVHLDLSGMPENDSGKRLLSEAAAFAKMRVMYQREARQKAHAKIARLVEWPICPQTGRSLHLMFEQGQAHWVCNDCRGKLHLHLNRRLRVPLIRPRKPLPRLQWVDGHLELK